MPRPFPLTHNYLIFVRSVVGDVVKIKSPRRLVDPHNGRLDEAGNEEPTAIGRKAITTTI
jgi:hypothetical protein